MKREAKAEARMKQREGGKNRKGEKPNWPARRKKLRQGKRQAAISSIVEPKVTSASRFFLSAQALTRYRNRVQSIGQSSLPRFSPSTPT